MEVLYSILDSGDRAPTEEQIQLLNLFRFPALNPFERHEVK